MTDTLVVIIAVPLGDADAEEFATRITDAAVSALPTIDGGASFVTTALAPKIAAKRASAAFAA